MSCKIWVFLFFSNVLQYALGHCYCLLNLISFLHSCRGWHQNTNITSFSDLSNISPQILALWSRFDREMEIFLNSDLGERMRINPDICFAARIYIYIFIYFDNWKTSRQKRTNWNPLSNCLQFFKLSKKYFKFLSMSQEVFR